MLIIRAKKMAIISDFDFICDFEVSAGMYEYHVSERSPQMVDFTGGGAVSKADRDCIACGMVLFGEAYRITVNQLDRDLDTKLLSG